MFLHTDNYSNHHVECLIAEEIPYVNVPLHTLLIVKSYGYDFQIETVPLKGKYLHLLEKLVR